MQISCTCSLWPVQFSLFSLLFGRMGVLLKVFSPLPKSVNTENHCNAVKLNHPSSQEKKKSQQPRLMITQ